MRMRPQEVRDLRVRHAAGKVGPIWDNSWSCSASVPSVTLSFPWTRRSTRPRMRLDTPGRELGQFALVGRDKVRGRALRQAQVPIGSGAEPSAPAIGLRSAPQ